MASTSSPTGRSAARRRSRMERRFGSARTSNVLVIPNTLHPAYITVKLYTSVIPVGGAHEVSSGSPPCDDEADRARYLDRPRAVSSGPSPTSGAMGASRGDGPRPSPRRGRPLHLTQRWVRRTLGLDSPYLPKTSV